MEIKNIEVQQKIGRMLMLMVTFEDDQYIQLNVVRNETTKGWEYNHTLLLVSNISVIERIKDTSQFIKDVLNHETIRLRLLYE